MLFASAVLSSWVTVMRAVKRIAVLTNTPAGRACRSTPSGRTTATSELASTTRLLCCRNHLIGRAACRRHHRSSDRAFDERRISQPDMAIAVTMLEDVADREKRAAQIGDDDDPVPVLGPLDAGFH